MKLPKHIKFYQIAALLILICSIGACKQGTSEEPVLSTVIVAPVVEQNVIESMSVVGQVVAKENVYLRARVKGFLTKRNFVEGSFITKNELLFQIEKTEYEAYVEASEAKLETAKANLKNDTIDYERQKYLADKNAVSQKLYDQAACLKAISEAGVLSAKAELKESKLNLSYTDIDAPFNGRIGLAAYSVGNVVGPDSKALAHVVMINPIQVEFNLTESFVTTLIQARYKNIDPNPKSKKGPSASEVIPKIILSNGTEFPTAGKINFIDNVINPMTGTIKMRAIFQNPKAILVPGAYVTVILQDRDKRKALLIPQAAIQEDQTGKYVMQVDKGNEVKKQEIETGSIYGIDIVVKSGLKLGDLVIKEGLQKVRGGIKVKPIMEEKPKKDTKKDLDDKEIEKKPSAPAKTTAKEASPAENVGEKTETVDKKSEVSAPIDKTTEVDSAKQTPVKTENKEKQPKQN